MRLACGAGSVTTRVEQSRLATGAASAKTPVSQPDTGNTLTSEGPEATGAEERLA